MINNKTSQYISSVKRQSYPESHRNSDYYRQIQQEFVSIRCFCVLPIIYDSKAAVTISTELYISAGGMGILAKITYFRFFNG